MKALRFIWCWWQGQEGRRQEVLTDLNFLEWVGLGFLSIIAALGVLYAVGFIRIDEMKIERTD